MNQLENSKKVCVYVDDDMMPRMMGQAVMGNILGDQWEVNVFEDADAGLQAISQRVHLLVLDYHLGLDSEGTERYGTEIAEARRTLEENGAPRIPILLHSSANNEIESREGLFDFKLPKPINRDKTTEIFKQLGLISS